MFILFGALEHALRIPGMCCSAVPALQDPQRRRQSVPASPERAACASGSAAVTWRRADPGHAVDALQSQRAGGPSLLIECMACGRRSGWTPDQWVMEYPEGHELEGFGLCRGCAAIPLDDLLAKIKAQQEMILYADSMRRAAAQR